MLIYLNFSPYSNSFKCILNSAGGNNNLQSKIILHSMSTLIEVNSEHPTHSPLLLSLIYVYIHPLCIVYCCCIAEIWYSLSFSKWHSKCEPKITELVSPTLCQHLFRHFLTQFLPFASVAAWCHSRRQTLCSCRRIVNRTIHFINEIELQQRQPQTAAIN